MWWSLYWWLQNERDNGAAAVINHHFWSGETTWCHLCKGLPDNITIFAADAAAITMALSYYQNMGPVHHGVVVYFDPMSCLQGEDTRNPFICHTMNILWLLGDEGSHVRFCWITKHCGRGGNGRVNQIEKETLGNDTDPQANATIQIRSHCLSPIYSSWFKSSGMWLEETYISWGQHLGHWRNSST